MLWALVSCDADSPVSVVPSGPFEESYEFDFALYALREAAPDLKGAPLAGASIAVDVDGRPRQISATGPDGRARIAVPSDADHVTWTVAKAGWQPVRTFFRASVSEIEAHLAAEGELYALMEPPPEPGPDASHQSMLTIQTPVPFCADVGQWQGCTSGSYSWPVIKQSQPFDIVVYPVDAQRCLLEGHYITIPDTLTDQTIDVLPGQPPVVAPQSYELRVRLPSDPNSLFRTEGPALNEHIPLRILDRSIRHYVGHGCNRRYDEDTGTLDATVSYVPLDTADLAPWVLLFPASAAGQVSSQMPVSIRLHTEFPGPAAFDAVDIPVLDGLDAPPTPSTIFRWQPIERARMYALEVSAPMPVATPLEPYRTLWVLTSWRVQEIELPALPPDYDPTSEWLTTTGRYRVWACERWVMPFGRLIRSVAPLDWACGLSDAVTGSIVPAH